MTLPGITAYLIKNNIICENVNEIRMQIRLDPSQIVRIPKESTDAGSYQQLYLK